MLTESNVLDSLSSLFEITKQKDLAPGLTESIQNIYNVFVNFSTVVEEKIRYIDERLNNVENQNRHLLSSISSGKQKEPIPKEISSLPKEIRSLSEQRSPAATRDALTNELKKLFQKRQPT